ncbi:hypothetical protein GGF43_005148, partial [Coemansia sp. RSA 2618]
RVRKHAEFTRTESPRPLFVDGSEDSTENVTFVQLESLCTKLASGLFHTKGVKAGDVVAVILPNSIHYTTVILSALMVGAACTLVNPAYTSREMGHQLTDARATLVITTVALSEAVEQAISEHSIPVEHVLVIDKPDKFSSSSLASIFDILCEQPFPRPSQNNATAVAFIPYSSGTTGRPKGVLLSHRNIVANMMQATVVLGSPSPRAMYPSTSVCVLPMFHSFGLLYLCLLAPVSGTATVVMTSFSMPRFLQLIQEHRVTDAMLVPPILNALVKMPNITQQYDLTSLATIVVGAAAQSTTTIETLESMMPHVRVRQGYGMTESSPTLAGIMESSTRNLLSVGRLAPNIEAKVVDNNGRVVGWGETGELCFRGPNIMLGYAHNPEATRMAFDSDGFLLTGDIGYIDKTQHIFLTDRKKELIKFNGFQVAPAELEGLLMQHPRVQDCAVAGVFDEKRQTEVPRAYLVLTPKNSPCGSDEDDAQAIVEWLNAQVAYFKQLRGGFAILDAIPKSASGKILRRMLA